MMRYYPYPLAGLCLLLLALSAAAEAPTVSAQTYEVLTAARESLENDPAAAAQKLSAHLGNIQDQPNDLALTNQMLGYAYSNAKNYAEAINAFKRALTYNELPADAAANVRFNLAQLLIQQEQYADGLKYLQPSLAGQIRTDTHKLAALAYYKTGNCAKATVHADALAQAEPDNATWADLTLSCQLQNKDYQGAARSLTKLIERQPNNAAYWLQLAGLYQQADHPAKAVAALELAEARGVLSPAQQINLVHLYLAADLPYRAATLLEKRMQSGVLPATREHKLLLADAWQRAQEFAKAAAQLEAMAGEDAELWLRAGQLYFQRGQWSRAISALQQAARGGGKAAANANLLMGLAAYYGKNLDLAQRAFNAAAQHRSTRTQAQYWLSRLAEPAG